MNSKRLHRELPAHLQFVQKLNCSIEGNLSNSSAQSLTLEELCRLSSEDLSSIELSYSSFKGSDVLRKNIAQFHQELNHHKTLMNEDNVLTFCGAQEALSSVYQAVLEPNDEVVVVTPNYPSLTQMAEQLGCVIKAINLSAENNWQVCINDFKSRINKNTKLIVINSPHNPTGSFIDSALAEEILTLAKQFDCYLIADDVSQASNYHNLPLSHRFLDYDKTIVISVMSKSFGLSGLRIGWAVSKNKDLLSKLLAIKSFSSICCSALDEAAAILAFENKDKIIKNNNLIIKSNIKLFQAFVDRYSEQFNWQPPKAGILAVVEVKNSRDIKAWAENMTHKTGVLVLPAILFGLTGNYFRLGLGQNNFEDLLAKLSDYLE